MSESKQASTHSAWGDRIRALKNVPQVLRIVWKSGPAVVSWGLILRVIVPVLGLFIGIVAARIITGVARAFEHQPQFPHFWWLVIAEIVLALLTGILSRTIDYTDQLLANRYTFHVSVQVMEQAAQLDLTTYENPEYYDRLERARAQATDRLAMIQQMGRLFQLSVLTLIWSGVLVYRSPGMILLLIAGVLPSFFGETHFAFLGYAKNFRQTPAKRQMDYLRQVGGSKEAAKELKLFNLSRYFSGRFRALSQQIYDEDVALANKKLLWGGLLSLISTAGYYGAYAFAIYEAVSGKYPTIGVFSLITVAIQQASTNFMQAFSTASGIADQALFLTDLIAFFEMKPTVYSKPNGLKLPRPIRRGFEFRNVSFAYPGTGRRVLKNFNFTLHPGERIALIGENGQGKTTIVKLITRLYDPTEGEILLDGVDLRDYDLDDLHHEMGVIFQDFMRYEMTAKENILVGHIEVPHTEEEIVSAAHKSLADTVVAKLADGYDQQLGRRFETGVDLSGGEWQKIALARAYLRDAQLLILDEPTAALDARSELEVFERFAELTEGKMALLISHRFSTVRMADRIVVLEGGQLVEEGTHSQLMALGGRYAGMFEMQAASYR
ncbi:ABC transporter ATP-binding protein [Silvibacterium dinghuense]|uniref:ABC transporter ATP-binding protein n=1 Tax=Silvibacterium dinghuense TaxID=1560006 RepID=A0A4Q1SHR6_9BACT|nr:ABC transporter ATP-binding protein [Silvibacterium dinghuense]RXS96939.1 ABC transporter ATP-binding protein [Silvibacterium dinghuense]GGG94864.1 ABC transporter ATP-binding protein [Silvibacterium dinghuense]